VSRQIEFIFWLDRFSRQRYETDAGVVCALQKGDRIEPWSFDANEPMRLFESGYPFRKLKDRIVAELEGSKLLGFYRRHSLSRGSGFGFVVVRLAVFCALPVYRRGGRQTSRKCEEKAKRAG